MKNTAVNSLGYSGIVTLSQSIGSKKVKIAQIHNTGMHSLFDFFSDCLLGDFDIAKNNRPKKIMLLKSEKDIKTGEISYKSRSGFISVLAKPEKKSVTESAESVVCYSFIISRDILKDNSFDHIGLYASATTSHEHEDFMAIVEISNDINQNLSDYSALVVDWELHISNRG